MPARARHRPSEATALVCAACVAATLAWPIVHFVWSKTQDADPWKLGGWAMYAVPSSVIEAVITADGVPLPRARLRPCLGVLDRFVARRKALGKTVEPVELAGCARRVAHVSSAIRVEVHSFRFDGSSRRIVEHVERYAYE